MSLSFPAARLLGVVGFSVMLTLRSINCIFNRMERTRLSRNLHKRCSLTVRPRCTDHAETRTRSPAKQAAECRCRH